MATLLGIAVLSGCGTNSAPSVKLEDDGAAVEERAGSDSKSGPAPSNVSSAGLAATTDEAGRKWLTPEIPYDVYPDLPSAAELIASRGETTLEPVENAPAITDDAETMEPASPPETAADEEAVASAGSAATIPTETAMEPVADGWEAILPVEVLDDEISVVNNRLGRNLLTVGSYNSSFAEVNRDGWEMSALATIASEHPATFSWKPNALLARDAAVAVAEAAMGRGRESFNEAELAGEQVSAVLNNNPPAGMDAPNTEVSRTETADRAALMSRIQLAHDRLKELAVDEAALREKVDDLNREARVLAALAKFTAHTDYDGAENEDYQAMAEDLVAAGMSMAQATADEDFPAFQSALNQAGTACNACHQKYRFAD